MKTKLKENIEIGAGCNNFGDIYYPSCVITDSDTQIKLRCKSHFVETFCFAWEIPFENDTFKNIISCNPWNYGFNMEEKGKIILNEFTRVIQNNGNIVIIGTKQNKFCAPWNIEQIINKMDNGVKYDLLVQNIDSSIEFPDFLFFTSTGEITTPTIRVIINVIK